MTETASGAGLAFVGRPICSSTNTTDAQLRERLAELAHSTRYSLARELAATIAHEINSPLGAILANTETLEALLQSPAPGLTELRVIASDIRRDTRRAADVIRHLQKFLKKSNLELQVLDLAEPVRDAILFFATLATAQNAHVNSSLTSMPLPVKGNPVLLHQAIMSIVVNAMDAMANLPVDQRKLEIVTARTDNTAEVFVSDTGPGIPADKLKEIFDPFFSTKQEGMGLGLSIARTIVNAHDGKISAENRSRGGAVFRVQLPLCEPASIRA